MVPFERLCAALAGAYEVEREVGRGGMACVYLARDLKHRRYVALKVLDPDLTPSLGAERFLLEISTTAQLNHPHILPLHDSGDAAGLLYYVLPYVEGETLYQRLQREGPFPIPDVVRIGADLADALSHAHFRGVLHRDIKPENVLLGHADHAYLTDFGLAKAVSGAATSRLTTQGLALGTPQYMSPEQAAGDSELDARSDVYSLGCLLYEMLTGRPPFEESSVQAVLAQQVNASPKPPRTVRPEIPVELEELVLRALAKRPSARPYAQEIADELRHLSLPVPRLVTPPSLRERLRFALPALSLLVVAALVMAWFRFGPRRSPTAGAAALDTTRYVVFRTAGASGLPTEPSSVIAQALHAWNGINVVDQRIVENQLGNDRERSLGLNRARSIARDLDAGRYVLSQVTGDEQQKVIEATVYDATTPGFTAIASKTLALPVDPERGDATLRALADSLLFPESEGIDGPIHLTNTRSAAAAWAYESGHDALLAWRLDRADSAFARATRLDPEFGEAYLWLAQVRGWGGAEVPLDWDGLAGRAAAHIPGTDLRHHRLASALLDLAEDRFPQACDIYQSLIAADSGDFVAWYGLGECLRRDNRVLPDPSSPTGYSFRTSYWRAIEAYEAAFRIRPSMLALFSSGGYNRLRRLLFTSSTMMRPGVAADSSRFWAYPAWPGDSLAFTPVPQAAMSARSSTLIPLSRPLAVRRMQQRFEVLADRLVASNAGRAEALEANAVALEMKGNLPAALDTLRRARRAATDSTVAVRLAAEEAWLLLRSSLPANLDKARRVRRLADSLLTATADWQPALRYELASLAALVGNAPLMGELMAADPAHEADRRRWTDPIVDQAQHLLAYAALGLDPDSLQALDGRVEAMITDRLSPVERPQARQALLRQAALLAFPTYRFPALDGFAEGDPLVAVERALVRHDSSAARARLLQALPTPASLAAGDHTIDMVFLESWLLDRVGAADRAASHLDLRFRNLDHGVPQLFRDPVQTASLIRGLCLRGDLAQREREPAVRATRQRLLSILRLGVDSSDPNIARNACSTPSPHNQRGAP